MAELFDIVKFIEAIDALRDRLAITKPEFLELDKAARSRAFTMARIADEQLLANTHDELSIAIDSGETWPDFAKRLDELKDRSGWTGTSPWHHRLVYDQNLSMAYSAGRVEQGRQNGLAAWRYLPSISANPRAEHEQFYNQVYRFAPGSPVPPLDFGCNCGWEWVFPEELEALGIDPETLPVFDPPPPKSGFVWSPSDYVNAHKASEAAHPDVQRWIDQAADTAAAISAKQFQRLLEWASRIGSLREIRERLAEALPRIEIAELEELNRQATLAAMLRGMVKEQEQVQTHKCADRRVLICELDAAVVPAEIEICPYGDVRSRSGDFIMDDAATEAVIAAFHARGVDLVIDYEHQSMGGKWSSPNGTAPAAGWIKELRSRPGRGLFARVEWTDQARQQIASKQYRYLSPVVSITKADGRAFELVCASLTNMPAIEGKAAIVHKFTPEGGQGGSMEKALEQLRKALGLAAESPVEQVIAAAAEALNAARETVGEQAVSAHSIRAGLAALKDAQMSAHKLAESENRVVALQEQLSGKAVEILQLRYPGRIPPCDQDWFLQLHKMDPARAEEHIRRTPKLVATTAASPEPSSGTPQNRGLVIGKALADFRAERDRSVVVCSERSWINAELRDAGMERLTDNEARQFGLSAR